MTSLAKQSRTENLFLFLQVLNELTKEECEISLQALLQEYKVPYSNTLPRILVDKGILELRPGAKNKIRIYKWDTIEPSQHMAWTLLNECRKLYNTPLGATVRIAKHERRVISYDWVEKLNKELLGEKVWGVSSGPVIGDSLIIIR